MDKTSRDAFNKHFGKIPEQDKELHSILSSDADIAAAKQMKEEKWKGVEGQDEKINFPVPYVTLNQKDYLEIFKKECVEICFLTERKGKDYSGTDDPFKNFKAIEHFTNKRISVEDGIIVRMTDKFTRIVNLLTKKAEVKDEAITDTLRDLAVYSLILKIYIEHKKNVKL